MRRHDENDMKCIGTDLIALELVGVRLRLDQLLLARVSKLAEYLQTAKTTTSIE